MKNKLAIILFVAAIAINKINLIAFEPSSGPSESAVHDSDNVNTKMRSITKVAEGIYMIRHEDAPDGFPQGNTTVIIGDKDVFVVDACYLPSSAKQDIDQIRKWTNKPVKWLLNTHWHYDHTMGNGTYASEFPDIHIIAHVETRNQIAGYNPGWFERYPGRAAIFQKFIDTGKFDDGKLLTESDKKDYMDAIAGIKPVEEAFKKIVDRIPDVTFENSLNINVGNREVQIKFLGRGNTAGDAIVYLPTEKIIVAGDLLDHPVPYLGGGFPSELVTSLKRMNELDANTFIPGHGNVFYGKDYLLMTIDFINTVVTQVSKEVYTIGNSSTKLDIVEEAVSKSINLNQWKLKFAGDDKANQEFFEGFSYPGLVKASYNETWRR